MNNAIMYVVLSGLNEEMEINTFEGVFATLENAIEYCTKCDAELCEDGTYRNSSEFYIIEQQRVL